MPARPVHIQAQDSATTRPPLGHLRAAATICWKRRV